MTTYDDLPIEVRRASWGWFGVPWWSYVCFDETGRLITEMRKPFPAGESCLLCREPFNEAARDSGEATPCLRADGKTEIAHVHKESSAASPTTRGAATATAAKVRTRPA